MVFRANVSVINASYTAAEESLAASMQALWSGFAKTGAPPDWPSFGADRQRVMRLQTPSIVVEDAAYRAKCDFWDALGYEWVLKP